MIYRLEEHTGMIYTKEEYLSHYHRVLPETPHLEEVYNSLPLIEVSEDKLSETRDKLLHIYASTEVPEVGDIIASCYDAPDKWYVYDKVSVESNLVMVEQCSDPNICKVWTGPFVTIVNTHSSKYHLTHLK